MERACESTLPPWLKPGSKPSSHRMRVVILASANSGCDVWPMISRALKTVPAGSPPPIFSAMRCNPSGVQFEPSICPMPKREVEQRNFLTNLLSSNSETVCSEMLTVKMKDVGSIFNRPQVARQASGTLFLEFIKRRLAQPEVKSTAALITGMRTRQFIGSRLGQLLYKHFGISSALVIFLATRGRQIVRRAFGKTAFGLKISERLRREREQFDQAHFARLVFDKLNQLPPDALVFVRRIDVKARQLALFLFGINVQRHAGDGILINLKNVIIAETFFNHGAAALDKFVRFDCGFRQQLNRADVFFLRGPDLLILVRVNQRADAVVRKNFRQQTFVHLAVDDVNAWHTRLASGGGVL